MTTKSRHSINWGQAFAEVLLIFIGAQVLGMAAEIIGLIDASLARA